MLRQTINLIEQQKAMRLMMLPRLIVSNNTHAASSQTAANTSTSSQVNTSAQTTKAIPKFDWNPVKYNFNFELLQNEYANYCKQYNLVNKFDKMNASKLARNQPEEVDATKAFLQSVIFNPVYNYNTFPTAESEDVVYDMQNKRSKQAKKKRSKRKNGGHQSIRC